MSIPTECSELSLVAAQASWSRRPRDSWSTRSEADTEGEAEAVLPVDGRVDTLAARSGCVLSCSLLRRRMSTHRVSSIVPLPLMSAALNM